MADSRAMDPTMRRTYGPSTAGKGAIYAWVGDGKAGAGRMTIVESTPPSTIGIALDFEKPMRNHADVAFAFAPRDGGTEVTWSMEARNDWIGKAMHVFFDAEKLVGDDFARGLAALKAVAEK